MLFTSGAFNRTRFLFGKVARIFKKETMATEACRVERIPLTRWRVGGPLDGRRRSVSRAGVVEVDRYCNFLQINEIC